MMISKGTRSSSVFWFSLVVAKLSFVGLVALFGLQVYTRWYVNKDFAFLPGFGLEALTISVFALILGLAYIHRSENS